MILHVPVHHLATHFVPHHAVTHVTAHFVPHHAVTHVTAHLVPFHTVHLHVNDVAVGASAGLHRSGKWRSLGRGAEADHAGGHDESRKNVAHCVILPSPGTSRTEWFVRPSMFDHTALAPEWLLNPSGILPTIRRNA